MNKICTICARGGSKGVKSKNTRMILDKPLIAHSILQAKASALFDAVAVSSDSREILDIARAYGADYLIERPLAMASDTAAKIPAIQHCLLQAEKQAGKQYDVIVDLDATSPLRSLEDIREALDLLDSAAASNVITAMLSRRSPYFNLIERDKEGKIQVCKKMDKPFVRRQDAPECYDMNASIYVWRRESLLEHDEVFQEKTALYVMPEERSIDIDSEFDFFIVECVAKQRGLLI